ncbi:hypothetical protein DFH08DRAFT_809074 [Mycena albidolilacea]|uniref:Uncharacterized protein n=1 Tax=Mycena albidolilacea TaxID=1033008 RepID=A0AAD7A0W8_9AGAR|nr:hypothetical protein DFH08DRAFT_809074 [Mycena albidolilacea]
MAAGGILGRTGLFVRDGDIFAVESFPDTPHACYDRRYKLAWVVGRESSTLHWLYSVRVEVHTPRVEIKSIKQSTYRRVEVQIPRVEIKSIKQSTYRRVEVQIPRVEIKSIKQSTYGGVVRLDLWDGTATRGHWDDDSPEPQSVLYRVTQYRQCRREPGPHAPPQNWKSIEAVALWLGVRVSYSPGFERPGETHVPDETARDA